MSINEAAEHFRNKLSHEIDAWDLNDLLRKGANVVVIDARSEAAYADEHIAGAVNLHHRKMSRETTRDLDRAPTYVTYCDGIGCNASTKGALKLAELGFRVNELIGGIEWWKRGGYPVESALVTINQS
jgi:rhodanese-related sulfurtransferase